MPLTADAPTPAAQPARQRRLPAALGAGLLLAALLLAAAVQWRLGGAAAGWLSVAVALVAAGAVGSALRRGEAHPRRLDACPAEQEPEAALRRSEAQLRALVDSLPDGVISMDENGAILAANPAATRLFGYAPHEFVGRNFAELAPGRSLLAGSGAEAECRRKDGASFPADVSVTEVKVGARRTYIGRIQDLTERKAAEEALRHVQRMEAVGQLTGGVAHDFNNILTVVMAYSGLLSDALEGGDIKLLKMSRAIQAAARNAADLTRQLLAFARRQSLEPAEVDVSDLLKAMQRLLRPALGDQITLQLRLTDEPARVFVDRAQLEAALMNLAVNGREAMPEGGRLTIETSLRQTGEGRRQVALAVRDEGVGMTAEVRERAFEPFFTTKEIGKGSGLGLSMVYGFVKQSGGDVRIESEPGQGASVTLLLPALPPERPDSSASAAREAAQRGDETILVVEDEPLVRDFVVNALRRLGYGVVEAADGPSALAEIEGAKRIDLVFTDVAMPGMSGFALAEAAQRKRPELRFLFTSGYADEGAAQRPRPGARIDLLHKPYEVNELAMRIRAALAERRP